ncbi:peptidase S41 [Clostridia bacterium]|nr:peptidase S41 [Clostridia bacterium]
MKKHTEFNVSIGLFFSVIFLTIVGTISVTMMWDLSRFNKKMKNISGYKKISAKIYELDDIVKNNFDGTIDGNCLVDAIRRGYLAGIGDDDSRYLSAEEYKQLKKDLQAQNMLWGVRLVVDGGYLKVAEVYNEASVGGCDFEQKDFIVKVDGVDVTSENVEECLKTLNADEGTKVNLVIRRGIDELEKEPVVRYIPISPLCLEVSNNIGYIKIVSFNEQAQKEFLSQFPKFISKCEALVIDLRNTAIGSIDCAAEILRKMLPQGLIVSAIKNDGENKNLFYSSGEDEIKKPIVVLVNGKTAGVAELFAQVLKHYKNAQLVGEKTAGKGKMQEIFELRDGSAVELTIAKFGLPDGSSFDETGIAPDFVVQLSIEQEEEMEKSNSREDLQLAKAREVLNEMLKNAAKTPGKSPVKPKA